MHHDEKPAFSYPVKVGNISANAVTVRLTADEAELKALRDLWDVLEVKSLTSELQIARWKRDGVKIKGRVQAKIVQACVVTLEPVESDIDEPVEAIFVPEGSRLARIAANDSGEMILDPERPGPSRHVQRRHDRCRSGRDRTRSTGHRPLSAQAGR